MRKLIAFGIVFSALFAFRAQSQTDSTSVWQKKPSIQLSGVIDLFYVFDFNEPTTNFRQPFFYNHNRHNEFNLNLGLMKLNVDHAKYRANFALQAGTYPNDNYAAEPGLLKNIFEANIGWNNLFSTTGTGTSSSKVNRWPFVRVGTSTRMVCPGSSQSARQV